MVTVADVTTTSNSSYCYRFYYQNISRFSCCFKFHSLNVLITIHGTFYKAISYYETFLLHPPLYQKIETIDDIDCNAVDTGYRSPKLTDREYS